MADLIDRKAAIDAIRKDVMGGLNYESILKRLPSSAWVVLCKDCVFRRDDHCDNVDYWIGDDDFCSRGEDGITWRT